MDGRQLAFGSEQEDSGGPERNTAVALPNLVTPTDKEIIIPVSVLNAAGKGIISYEFDLRYDPLVIQPQAEPVDLSGTASRGLTSVANISEPGLLRVVVYGVMPLDDKGVLLNLRFTTIGATGTISPLTLESFIFNEGLPMTVTDGLVTVNSEQ